MKGRTLGFNLKILSGRDATITAEVSEVEDEVEVAKLNYNIHRNTKIYGTNTIF